MTTDGEELVAELLTGVVTSLDVPEHIVEATHDLYRDVAAWLNDDLEEGEWDFYIQGSARLGTIVLPAPGDEHDIDAVASRSIPRENVTKKELKSSVGKALTRYTAVSRPGIIRPTGLVEGRRCWTLEFDLPLHMDVLPAVPDEERPPTGILLTDSNGFRWLHSDPIAYADWFFAQQENLVLVEKASFAKRAQVNVGDVPEWRIRTQLQRVVQVLKAHRNIYFSDELSLRPASILVTTLAAQAYRVSATLFSAVIGTAEHLSDFIDRDGLSYQVLNPVQPLENFADRWTTTDARLFSKWIDQLRRDLEEVASTAGGLHSAAARMAKSFGESAVDRTIRELGQSAANRRTAGSLAVGTAGALGATQGLRVRDHTFHN